MEAAERLSVPASVLNDEATVKRKEAQAQADQNLQRAQVASEIAKNHSQAQAQQAQAQSGAQEGTSLMTGATQVEQ